MNILLLYLSVLPGMLSKSPEAMTRSPLKQGDTSYGLTLAARKTAE
jgi:hypothetical protein